MISAVPALSTAAASPIPPPSELQKAIRDAVAALQVTAQQRLPLGSGVNIAQSASAGAQGGPDLRAPAQSARALAVDLVV